MKVNSFSDHLAYTFEAGESMFMLGMRMVKKAEDDLIPAVDVTYNSATRLLYGTEGLRPLSEIAGSISNSELAMAFIKFVKFIRKVEDNDFLKITALDINYNRLYYDTKNKIIKIVLLPVNFACDFHDGQAWSASFRTTVLLLLNRMFVNTPNKYDEMYFAVMDETKSDYDVLDFLASYDYGLRSADGKAVSVEGAKAEGSLALEHKEEGNNLVFLVKKDEFVLGKSRNADGCIVNSTMVSRNHCKIVKMGVSYMVQDLNSTNGTYINGYLLSPSEMYYLNDGDILMLADVEFKAVLG